MDQDRNNKFSKENCKTKLKINEKNISYNLYTKDIPDPDVLIRTGNTKRISNFLIWQSIYRNFLKKMWPDFTKRFS